MLSLLCCSYFFQRAPVSLDGSDSPSCRDDVPAMVRPRVADDHFRRTGKVRDESLLRGSAGGVGRSKPIQRHRSRLVALRAPVAAGAVAAVGRSRVEDEVSGELDRLAEVQKHDDGAVDVQLRVAELLDVHDESYRLDDD